MKWIGKRVSYKYHTNFFTMIISPKTEDWKLWVMFFWFLAWLTCGVVVIYTFFFTEDMIDSKVYFTTFLLFWFYFLYKISRVILWRKYGIEFIKIDEDRLSIKKSIFGFGKAREYLLDNIEKFELEPLKENSYAKVFNDSFWVVGQGTIVIISSQKEDNFGAQISLNDGKEIVKILNSSINKYI